MINYVRNLSAGKIILWSYLIWYFVMAGKFFDPTIRIWASSIGISAIIGVALILSTSSWPIHFRELNLWQTVRLFAMPFCVSSYSALIKGRGFVLLFSPSILENLMALGVIAAFLVLVGSIKKFGRETGSRPSAAEARGAAS